MAVRVAAGGGCRREGDDEGDVENTMVVMWFGCGSGVGRPEVSPDKWWRRKNVYRGEEVFIVNGDAPAIASASAGTEGLIPPKTAKQKLARKNELKAKKHSARFGGNKESKKMQKTILKQQYENFAASRSEGLDKTYDRFQKLISQLEIHGEVISQEDANLKLLRSLPSAWNNIALIMRNKSDLDTLSMDDLYNNLKVYESEIKGQSSSKLLKCGFCGYAYHTGEKILTETGRNVQFQCQMNESEVVHSVFNSRESNVDNSPVNDRFKTGEGFHAVPPPYTRNYMPSRPDLSFARLDDFVYKTKVSETETVYQE
ncbi:hypothetical protein Tco_1553694 [Tanacetum coccineum]